MIRSLRAWYGHPGAGTFWAQLCDGVRVKTMGVLPIDTWPSCYYNPKWELRRSVYVGDFKKSCLEQYLDVALQQLPTYIEMGEPTSAGLYVGCKHSYTMSKLVSDTTKRVLYDMKDDLM